jgi:hypothetical protein
MSDPQKAFYVDSISGNDNASGTFENPLKTIEEAYKRMQKIQTDKNQQSIIIKNNFNKG